MSVFARNNDPGSMVNSLLQNHEALGTAGRFLLVGVLNTVFDVGVFMLLRVCLGMAVLPANVSAYGAGILNSFVWHRHWTYAHRPHKAIVAQFAQFALVSGSALEPVMHF